MTRLIILRGYPGSGKTTIGKLLAADRIGNFIDHNAILTFLARTTGDDEGIYDEIATLELAMCRKLLSEGKDVIVARGFSSLASLQAYENMAQTLYVPITIFRLDVSTAELMSRVQSPERQLGFNPTTSETQAQDWMTRHPIENHPDEITVDNERAISDVIAHLKTVLYSQ